MTTSTLPDAERIPSGFFVSSSIADHKLEWGKDGEVYGDWIDQSNLAELVEVDMQVEADVKQCENCERYDESVRDVQIGRDEYVGWCEDCRDNVEFV